MGQSTLAFGLAAVFLIAEMLSRLMPERRSALLKVLLNRWVVAILLSVAAAASWGAGWLTWPVASATVILLVAESSLLSVRQCGTIPAKLGVCALAGVVLAAVLAMMLLTGIIENRWLKGNPDLRITEFEQAKMKVLAKLVGEKYVGSKTLVITADRLPGMSEEEAAAVLQTVKEALAGKAEVAAVEKVEWALDKGNVRLKLNSGIMDKLVAAHPECTLVVSLVGLPHDYEELASLKAEDGPVFILANQIRQIDNDDLKRLMQEGRVAACVTLKSGWAHRWRRNPAMPPTAEKAVQQRYNLVTPDNIR